MSLLSIKHLTKSFGGLQAVRDLSFDLHEGTILGLIGPNGAGKSTVFNCISGFDTYDSGSVSLQGEKIENGNITAHISKGIYRTFQNTELFDEMTVLENVCVALISQKPVSFLKSLGGHLVKSTQSSSYEREAFNQLIRFNLEDLAHAKCSTLGAGMRRVVEVIRAQATNPKVLLLDEPAAGLNPSETLALKHIISRIRDFDTSIILVEHDLKLVMDICDEVLVLDQGKRIALGPPFIIQKDPEVINAYLGKSAPEE